MTAEAPFSQEEVFPREQVVAQEAQIEAIRKSAGEDLSDKVIKPINASIDSLKSFAFSTVLLPGVHAVTVSVDTFREFLKPAPPADRPRCERIGMEAGRQFAPKFLVFMRKSVGVPKTLNLLLKAWTIFDSGARWGEFVAEYDEKAGKVRVTVHDSFLTLGLKSDRHQYCDFMAGYVRGVLWVCMKSYPKWYARVTGIAQRRLEPVSVRESPEGAVCIFELDVKDEELSESFDELEVYQRNVDADRLEHVGVPLRVALEVGLKRKMKIPQEEPIYVPQLIKPFKREQLISRQQCDAVLSTYAKVCLDAHQTTGISKHILEQAFLTARAFIEELEVLPLEQARLLELQKQAFDERTASQRSRSRGIAVVHAPEDLDFVQRLTADLRRTSPAASIRAMSLARTDSLSEYLSDPNGRAAFLLPVLSPEATEAAWLMSDIQRVLTTMSRDGSQRVIPVLARDCEPPTFLVGQTSVDFRQAKYYQLALEGLLYRLSGAPPVT